MRILSSQITSVKVIEWLDPVTFSRFRISSRVWAAPEAWPLAHLAEWLHKNPIALAAEDTVEPLWTYARRHAPNESPALIWFALQRFITVWIGRRESSLTQLHLGSLLADMLSICDVATLPPLGLRGMLLESAWTDVSKTLISSAQELVPDFHSMMALPLLDRREYFNFCNTVHDDDYCQMLPIRFSLTNIVGCLVEFTLNGRQLNDSEPTPIGPTPEYLRFTSIVGWESALGFARC
jgi:hypothetical protein